MKERILADCVTPECARAWSNVAVPDCDDETFAPRYGRDRPGSFPFSSSRVRVNETLVDSNTNGIRFRAVATVIATLGNWSKFRVTPRFRSPVRAVRLLFSTPVRCYV